MTDWSPLNHMRDNADKSRYLSERGTGWLIYAALCMAAAFFMGGLLYAVSRL